MNRLSFLRTLHHGLAVLAPGKIDTVDDYEACFDGGEASGRCEEDVGRALGDPWRPPGEIGLQRREDRRSLGNSAAVLSTLRGLARADLLFVLSLVFAVTLTALVFGLVICAIGIVGIDLSLSIIKWHFHPIAGLPPRGLAGIKPLGASIGRGAPPMIAFNAAVRMLGNYVQPHYRPLKTEHYPA